MKFQEDLHNEEAIEQNKLDKVDRIHLQDQVSNQHNSQDLDQEQNVDVKPVQLNTQNLHITTGYNISDYSGQISGVTYLEEDKKVISDVNILLYFGDISKIPVYKTMSDKNGNFVIKDLPPGYYSLVAYIGKKLEYAIQYIKVLAGQNVYHAIHLREKYNKRYEGIVDKDEYYDDKEKKSDKVVEYIFFDD